VSDEKASQRKQILTIFGARGMYENHCRVRSLSRWADESACELDVVVEEADVFPLFDIHAPRGSRRRGFARPRKRRDLTRGIALKFNPRLD
jgi:hypothetical protein